MSLLTSLWLFTQARSLKRVMSGAVESSWRYLVDSSPINVHIGSVAGSLRYPSDLRHSSDHLQQFLLARDCKCSSILPCRRECAAVQDQGTQLLKEISDENLDKSTTGWHKTPLRNSKGTSGAVLAHEGFSLDLLDPAHVVGITCSTF